MSGNLEEKKQGQDNQCPTPGVKLKKQLEETGKKQDETGRKGKKQKNWKKKKTKTEGNWMILKEIGGNSKKQ